MMEWSEELEKTIVAALQAIVRNDTTMYDHHQPRRWDGRTPEEAGDTATRWLAPSEIARGVLRRIGAPVPDCFAETLERAAARAAQPINTRQCITCLSPGVFEGGDGKCFDCKGTP